MKEYTITAFLTTNDPSRAQAIAEHLQRVCAGFVFDEGCEMAVRINVEDVKPI